MRRAFALAAAFALTAPALALAGSKPLPAPLHPPAPRLDKTEAKRIFLADRKVALWLHRYPRKDRTTETTFKKGIWTVRVWRGRAGEIATGKVDDRSGAVVEAWTGPQVAWKMARGYGGAFGGKEINNPALWLGFCALFLIGLGDLRRPFSLRNLDLLALLSFSVSLWYFTRGDVFTSVPLAYPPLLYLLGRMLWSAARGRLGTASVPVWPIWVLAAATIFTAGFRIGLNLSSSNVIDVGYSGVIGADLLCLLGLALVGLRFGGTRLAVTLAFAWVAYPFTQSVSNSNPNDALPPLFLIWGFWLVTSPVARGAAVALAGWTKFAPLIVAPLWASYPEGLRRPRQKAVFVAAFAVATLVAFSILLFEPNLLHALRVFWDRTIPTQVDRQSPFSIWDWRQYHAGLPDLHILQRVLEG